MAFPRVIPTLLLKSKGLYKGVSYKAHSYVGDPVNTVKIFNEKEVDEIALFDIESTLKNKLPDYELLIEILSEAFMPISYGGGVNSLDIARKLFSIGVEKVILGTAPLSNLDLIKEITDVFGSQSVCVSVDVKKNIFGKYNLYSHSGKIKLKENIMNYIDNLQSAGAGEIILNVINNDGKRSGYDFDLIKSISNKVKVPLIVGCGAGSVDDFEKALSLGADSVAAGSMFVYQGPHKAVLISYLNNKELQKVHAVKGLK